MICEILGAARVAFTNFESSLRERSRQLRFLEECAGGCEKNAHFSTTDSFQSFDSLPCNFGMRLYFAESLARGIESYGCSIDQGLEISEPALRSGDTFGDDDVESAGTGVRERSDGERVAGTREPR
jgi:hypothetical protein